MLWDWRNTFTIIVIIFLCYVASFARKSFPKLCYQIWLAFWLHQQVMNWSDSFPLFCFSPEADCLIFPGCRALWVMGDSQVLILMDFVTWGFCLILLSLLYFVMWCCLLKRRFSGLKVLVVGFEICGGIGNEMNLLLLRCMTIVWAFIVVILIFIDFDGREVKIIGRLDMLVL